jgi:hypothetical protein
MSLTTGRDLAALHRPSPTFSVENKVAMGVAPIRQVAGPAGHCSGFLWFPLDKPATRLTDRGGPPAACAHRDAIKPSIAAR